MQAIRLERIAEPLKLVDIERPELVPGGVLVRVHAAPVLSFAHRVFKGEQGVEPPPVPYTPGCGGVGVVSAVAPDVLSVRVGDIVFCNPLYTAPLADGGSAALLIGWFGLGPGSQPLVDRWKNGTFAEYALFPAECLTPLPAAIAKDMPRLAVLNALTIAYGALVRGNCHAGDIVIVNGATGNMGAAAVMLALAFGASRVVAVGREATALAELTQLDPRVIAAELGEHAGEYANIVKTALGACRADLVIDAIGGAPPDPSLACIKNLRPRGTAIWMGSVSAPVPLDFASVLGLELTVRGSFMYDRDVPARVARMIASGQLSLAPFGIETFPLTQADQAVKTASERTGLHQVVITP